MLFSGGDLYHLAPADDSAARASPDSSAADHSKYPFQPGGLPEDGKTA
jgi:hypothetical protein